ncbi:MAG: single-stranded DNA-binding protein, partial [Candidatus Gracilibacteria bacterium]|nr:single-stranded DNA-binding protein [Candidatus Gracilibacteria bacterium]
KKVALFNIATNRFYKSANGETKNEAEYTNCIAWGSLADRCEQYLVKGKLVYCEGRLKTRMIEKEGIKTYKTEIVVTNLIFLNKRSDFEEGGEGTSPEHDELDLIDEEFNTIDD